MGVRRRSSSASPVSRKRALIKADAVPAPVEMCRLCGLPIGEGAGVQVPFVQTPASSSSSSSSSSSTRAQTTYNVIPGDMHVWFHHNCAKEWFRTHPEDKRDHMNKKCYFELYLETGRKKYS